MSVRLSSLILICLSTMASADEPPQPFPQDRLCPMPPLADVSTTSALPSKAEASRDLVSPQAIVAWLLDAYAVRDSALDVNRDGNTLINEKIQALIEDDFCSSISTRCSEADAEALAMARAQLEAFADKKGAPGYRVEQRHAAGQTSPRRSFDLTPEDLLALENPTLRIRCVALPQPAEITLQDETTYWHANGENGFRLTGDIDNLSKSRGSLSAVRAAELSITSNLIEDETAYRVNAVAGYAFGFAGGSDVQTSFIPFLEAERVTSGSETQIDTLGAGFQQAAKVNWPGPLRSEFAITPVYQTDSDFDSHTGTLKFRWTPSLAETPLFPLGFAQVYGPIELHLGLDLLADAGRVFDDGDENNLDGEGSFLRLGNQAALQVRGAPGNLFRQFEIQLANRYLYNVDTEFESINQFDAAIAYLFPDNENYQLSFAYSNGRDDNSLELYEFWQTQFGVRF